MAANVKRKFARTLGLMLVMVLALVCLGYYVVLGEVEIRFARNPGTPEVQEALRKLKLFEEAQAAKRNGFIRLSEAEINSLLQARKTKKDRTPKPVELVKTRVLLRENQITFINWQSFTAWGNPFSLVWQRDLAAERTTNGWKLSLRGMRVGKVTIPERFWPEVTELLGVTDGAFDERKAWLAQVPTVMLARNELTQKPELRFYTYIPMVKDAAEAALPGSDTDTSAAVDSPSTLTARLTL
jgi:hypothetical protein